MQIAVVTGANRGLGWGVSEALAKQGFMVVMLGRDKEKIQIAAERLIKQNLRVLPYQVDVTNEEQIKNLVKKCSQMFGVVDVLVNNAGVLFEKKDSGFKAGVSIMTADIETVRRTLEVNTLGPLRLCQYMLPLLKKSKQGRIVNVSSQMGSLTEMGGEWPGYRISKAALNAVTCILHAELQAENSNIKVNSVSPGWVRTDMGGPGATRSLEEGVKGIVWAATLPDDGPSGGFYRDGKPLPW